MPQPLPATSRARSYSAPVPRAVRTIQTSPDHPPYLVRTQPYCFEDFGTKSTGEGGTLPHPGAFTSNLVPRTSNLSSIPLPLSHVLLDNEVGCAWPDRTSFRKKIQDGQQGPQALCRGVSGGWASKSSLSKTSCLPAEVAGQFRSIGERDNARNHHPSMPHMQEPELLHHEEQEDDHRPPRVLKVLQHLPQAHGAQRDEVRAPLASAVGTSLKPTAPGGVSSTVKLSVSKTELLGSNPSSPASFPPNTLAVTEPGKTRNTQTISSAGFEAPWRRQLQ
jgi:hypothetical protein